MEVVECIRSGEDALMMGLGKELEGTYDIESAKDEKLEEAV